MTIKLNEKQYNLIKHLINSISNQDTAALLKLNLSIDIQEEITECLEIYYDSTTTLTAPPLVRSSESADGGRSLIECFYMNDGNIGIECILFADGKAGEAILHAELTSDTVNPKISYKYIGS